jgi:succinyl-CoA synthetase beta subunit
MLLLEHQGKALLRQSGIAAPRGMVVADDSALAAAIRTLPQRLVLKAQIEGGGRGKAGGIAFADTAAEALAAFGQLRARSIHGLPVQSVLVEERIDYLAERYVALTLLDGEIRLMFGRSGGIDIEDATARDPASLTTMMVDPIDGPSAAALTACFRQVGLAPEYRPAYEAVSRALYSLAQRRDLTLAEINPLVELSDGRLLALDARIGVDDAALLRQPEIAALPPPAPATAQAKTGVAGLRFKENPEGGAIGLIGLGGGLNVTLMDWVASAGGRVGSVVDIDPAIGSGHAAAGFTAAFEAFDGNPMLRAIMVNVITCGYRLDDIVAGLVKALETRAEAAKPVILHLRGNAMERTPDLLEAAGCRNGASIAAAIAEVIAAAGA